MKTFNVRLWNIEGDGYITVVVEAPDSRTACQYVEDSLCWSYEEVEEEDDGYEE